MNGPKEASCPGCGLLMPLSDTVYEGYFNTSPECWSVFTEVVGSEFNNVVLFGQAHQLTVDSFAAQHAGGAHPDKSVAIHLCGPYLVFKCRLPPTRIPRCHQHLANTVEAWPQFDPPDDRGSLTVFDVAMCDSPEEHIETVREWAGGVWAAWSRYHADVEDLVNRYLQLD